MTGVRRDLCLRRMRGLPDLSSLRVLAVAFQCSRPQVAFCSGCAQIAQPAVLCYAFCAPHAVRGGRDELMDDVLSMVRGGIGRCCCCKSTLLLLLLLLVSAVAATNAAGLWPWPACRPALSVKR